jgi:hypothetical protein
MDIVPALSVPARDALRQADSCCGEMPCRRATSDTTAPAAQDSATIRLLTSSLQRRRRFASTWILIRPRGSELSAMSTICANRSAKDGSHFATQPASHKVG